MQTPDSHCIDTLLAQRTGVGADVERIADASIAILQEFDDALAPIVGRRGVAMLYKRCIFLSSPAYPWLAGVHGSVHTAADFPAFRSALVQQDSANAAAGSVAVLQNLYQLLITLIGAPLTGRLLRAAWAAPASDTPAEDPSPHEQHCEN